MYPVETAKVRLQSGKSAVPGPDEGGAGALYTGLGYGVGKECPNAAIYIATYGFLKPRFLALPFLDPSSGAAIFAALAAAGALGDAAGSVVRVPLELLNKLRDAEEMLQAREIQVAALKAMKKREEQTKLIERRIKESLTRHLDGWKRLVIEARAERVLKRKDEQIELLASQVRQMGGTFMFER